MFRFLSAIVFCLLVTTLHAKDRYDWDGKWEIIIPFGDPMRDILYVEDGAVQGLRVAGCAWVPPDTFELTENELKAHFVVPGREYTIIFVRSSENEAKVFRIDGPEMSKFDRHTETREIAYRRQAKSCDEG